MKKINIFGRFALYLLYLSGYNYKTVIIRKGLLSSQGIKNNFDMPVLLVYKK